MNKHDDPVTITPCPDGPLLVRGDFMLALNPGAEPQKPPRRVVALCRCGLSAILPYCDSSHKLAGFQAPITAAEHPDEKENPTPG